jgi:hypothetical protein
MHCIFLAALPSVSMAFAAVMLFAGPNCNREQGPGVVIPPERLLAYQELALAKYTPLDALISEAQLCDVVEAVLQMPAQVSGRGLVGWALRGYLVACHQ